jgi:hypothetical protein
MEFSFTSPSRKLLETITGYKVHQGALAVAKIPPLPDLETLLKDSPRPLLLAAVEGIASRGKSRRGGAELRGVRCAFPDCGRDVRQSVSAPRGARFDGNNF